MARLSVFLLRDNTVALGASPAIGDPHSAGDAAHAVLLSVGDVVLGEIIGPAVGRWRGATAGGFAAACSLGQAFAGSALAASALAVLAAVVAQHEGL